MECRTRSDTTNCNIRSAASKRSGCFDFLSLGERPLRLARGIKRVGKRDGVELFRVSVFDQRRIDIEDHCHFALLARLQPLFLETETVDLLKIRADRQR